MRAVARNRIVTMSISKLVIKGFRSFREQSWSPGNLNVVIGPNASGKSNLLRVLELLQFAARGGLGRYIQQEGGMDAVLWDGQADQLRFSLETPPPLPPYRDREKDALTYDLTLARLGTSSAYRVDYELLGNFYKVHLGEMREPFKLLERDPRHAVVFSPELGRFEHLNTSTTTTTTTPDPSATKRVEASRNSVSEEETLLSAAGGPLSVERAC